jgi:hypothetical protein
MAFPTATHACDELHDTEYSPVSLTRPDGRGTCWMRHLLPFHASANGESELGLLVPFEPTATQTCFDVHDTS